MSLRVLVDRGLGADRQNSPPTVRSALGTQMDENQTPSSPSSSNDATPLTSCALPTSVVGAPPHMRDAIRRAQNAAAARRSRVRRKLKSLNKAQGKQEVPDKDTTIEILEARVRQLEAELAEAGYSIPDELNVDHSTCGDADTSSRYTGGASPSGQQFRNDADEEAEDETLEDVGSNEDEAHGVSESQGDPF